MTESEIALILEKFGCPPAKCLEMARQLEKRAHQLAEAKGQTVDEARIYLLGLMKEGSANNPRGNW